jgi:hypothetical protein
VAIVLRVAGPIDDVANRLVDLTTVATGSDLIEPDKLSSEHQLVGLTRLRTGLADGDRAGAI